jgi:hypothetical protein
MTAAREDRGRPFPSRAMNVRCSTLVTVCRLLRMERVGAAGTDTDPAQ